MRSIARGQRMNETPAAITINASPYVIPHEEKFFEYNRGVHPNVPPRLSAPALNWHQAFWNYTKNGKSEDGKKIEPIDDLIELIISILNNQDADICDVNGIKYDIACKKLIRFYNKSIEYVEHSWKLSEKGPSDQNPFRFGDIQISFLWGGQLVKMSVYTHLEFSTLTVWLPAYKSGGSPERKGLCRGEIANDVRKHLRSIMHHISSETTVKIEKYLDIKGEIISQRDCANYLYSAIWAKFAKDFFETYYQYNGRKDSERIKSFADFRSVIIPDSLPFCPRDQLASESPVPHFPIQRFTSAAARDTMRKVEDFLKVESGTRVELTGSSFLDRIAVYGSSLGSENGDDSHVGRGRSPRYLMVIKPSSRWQLGRLIERLNLLGTYRLAALRDLQQLNEASKGLRDAGRKLADLDAETIEDLDVYRKKYENQIIEFAKIGSDCTGSLNYRVERSRYYVETFKRILPDLRIGRIEGFQPYDEFIRRRYGLVWDRINRIGIRRERLAQRFDFFSNRVETAEQVRQSKALNDQNTASKNILQQIEKQNINQTQLMHAAHWIETVALSYYGGLILGSIIEQITYLNTGEHYQIFSLFIFSITRINELRQKDHHHGESYLLRRGWNSALAGVSIVSALALLCIYNPPDHWKIKSRQEMAAPHAAAEEALPKSPAIIDTSPLPPNQHKSIDSREHANDDARHGAGRKSSPPPR